MFTLKSDRYRRARGGYARFLHVTCVCGEPLCLYQKDGPGPLKRMYLDRIFAPRKRTLLEKKTIKTIPLLRCARCKRNIGVAYIYPKERRKAYLLDPSACKKRVGKGEWNEKNK